MVSQSLSTQMNERGAAESQIGTDSSWNGLYTAGALAAVTIVLVGLLDMGFMFVPGTSVTPGTLSAVDWFALFQHSWFVGLRNLGILNVINTACMLPVMFALYAAHRRDHPAAALALIVLCTGTAVYIANNHALAMLGLSQQYMTASAAQKPVLAAAGQVLLAQSEDLTAGTFTGFFLSELAGLGMALIMLRGRVFSRWTAWAGILGEACLLIFNIGAAFVPAIYNIAMLFAMLGGPLSMLWLALIAVGLLRLKK